MQALNPVRCRCSILSDLVVEEFGLSANARRLRRVKNRGLPQWWLSLNVCDGCGQNWLVAQEERLNDVYVLRKVDTEVSLDITERGNWPTELDLYEALLVLGKEAGHAARFMNASDAEPIAIDLVGQRPEISPQEFGYLVNLPSERAEALLSAARAKIALHSYPYPWAEA